MQTETWKPVKQYVKYVPVGVADTHSMAVGYLFWLVGFTGAHRFFYGRTLTGILWALTFGLFGIGWIVDAFLIPSMDREAGERYCPGTFDYNLSWLLLVFAGVFGLHRFYQGKVLTGLLFLCSGGLFGVGVIYDVLTLNEQISDRHAQNMSSYHTVPGFA